MRAVVSLLGVWVLAAVALAQAAPNSKDGIRIRTLTIESTTLPAADRERIRRQFEGSTYDVSIPDGIGGFQDSLQVLGYFKARVGDPRISFVKQEGNVKIVDVTVAVEEGPRYYLHEIRFRNATAFPSERLRAAFPIETGEVFNVEKIRGGIQNLHKLYDSQGYTTFTPVPDTAIDDSRRTVDVNFDLDEGKQFSFGPLVLDGPEPHAGAGKALLESWKNLKGRRYSSNLLERWFLANQSNLPPGKQILELVRTFPDQASQIVTVRLSFP